MGKLPKFDSNGEQIISATVEKYGLQYVRPYHREIARRMVIGQTFSKISKELNISHTRLSQIANSPMFKKELLRLEELRDKGVTDVTQTLRELSPIAVETIERTMYNAKSEKLRFDAATEILDRAGYGAINKSVVNVRNEMSTGQMSDDELRRVIVQRVERMKAQLEQEAEDAAKMQAIDVDFEEVVEKEDDCSTPEQLAQLTKEFMG